MARRKEPEKPVEDKSWEFFKQEIEPILWTFRKQLCAFGERHKSVGDIVGLADLIKEREHIDTQSAVMLLMRLYEAHKDHEEVPDKVKQCIKQVLKKFATFTKQKGVDFKDLTGGNIPLGTEYFTFKSTVATFSKEIQQAISSGNFRA